MKILVADDNLFYRNVLNATLQERGYEVVSVTDGDAAWQHLQQPEAPPLALLDWMMPRLTGLEVCRRLRAQARPTYLILLTARGSKENLVTALQGGADDYIHKPFDRDELHARLQVGLRIVGLQTSLAARVQELEQALSVARKLEIMGRLAGGVAHDFNNLLTIIGGASELLLAPATRHPEQLSLVKMIKEAGDRGAALTRQLLAFGRGQVLATAVHELNGLVRGSVNLLRRLMPADVVLQLALADDAGHIRADAGQMGQVLMNLAINARDAMPGGGVVTLRTAAAAVHFGRSGLPDAVPSGDYACLQVADAGCGMSDDVQARAFEPFFTTKQGGKGTGLGLSTVYGIVKQSGGFIQLDSAPGRGTVFSIYLPRAAPAAALAPGPAPEPAVHPGRQTILLVEDEEHVRTIARRILREVHFHVLEARDGEEALEVSRGWDRPIDLLLTDVVMPRLNGRQLVDRLAPERPGLRVLFMSGYTAEVVLQRDVPQEAIPFLEKPFTPRTLLDKVREVLEQ
jgi:signal transduction histidine kinase